MKRYVGISVLSRDASRRATCKGVIAFHDVCQSVGRSICRSVNKLRFLIALVFILASVYHSTGLAAPVDTVVIESRAEGRLDFRVNLTNVDRDYHSNDARLMRVLAQIDSLVLNPQKTLRRITVLGTASPEGPYLNNVRLARNRARAFINILRERYNFPDSIYDITTIPEDWDGMRAMLVADSAIPYSQVVLSFIDSTADLDPQVREWRLKHLDGGRPYASMHTHVLPYLRRATVELDYGIYRLLRRPEGVAAPAIVPMAWQPAPPATLLPALAVAPSAPKNRFFALKTNLLGDALLCANLGFEFELWPRWSIDVPVWYSPYDITQRWRIRLLAIQPELRYWPKEAGRGHYFGLHTSVVGFNVSFNGPYRYQDPNYAAFGLGVGYGYAFHLDKAHRWGLEAQVGAGYISYRWIKYHNTGRNGAEVSRGHGTYWGITRLGVTLSYKFYAVRKGRRWMQW